MSLPHPDDLQETWAFIEPSLYKILGTDDDSDGVTPDEYMSSYTAVYNYCVSRSKGGSTYRSSTNSILLIGSEIYARLKNFLTNYVLQLTKRPDETFLQFYVRRWRRYTIGAGYLNNVFDYMNRYWVSKERSDGRRDIYDVNTLALLTWRENMFDINCNILVAEILEQIRLHRLKQQNSPALLTHSIKSFVMLGIDIQDLKKPNLGIYIDKFEKQYLINTIEFYNTESNEYLKTHNLIDYMKRAEHRIADETSFATNFLDERSRRPLLETVCKSLIENHAPVMYEEFERLLQQDQFSDINRMYLLMQKVQSSLDPLARKFEGYIKSEGLMKIDNMDINDDNKGDRPVRKAPPKVLATDQQKKLYIKTLIAVYTKFVSIVEKAFNNDLLFVKALDNACRGFINKNSVASPPGYKGTSKTPEYLAKYTDLLMRKNARENDVSSDMSEDDVMTIFKFITDKDAFESHYRKLLAKRLIYGTSMSVDTEESIISRLQKENSVQYTSKMTKMFQDMKASTDLQAAFAQYVENKPNKKEILDDFNVYVLAETMWPFSAFKHEFSLPKELMPTYDALESLYNEKHTGRQLKWIWNLCRGEIKANISKPGKPPFILTMTLFQMAIILRFNEQDTYTFAELVDILKLPEEYVSGNLAPLIKYKLLNQSPPDAAKIGETSTKFTVVKEYRSKRMRVNFASNIKIEQKQELEETTKEIEQGREMFLQACIVRIMKARKQLKHVLLVNEVIQQSHTRFKAQVSDIKKAIENLIEREYLRRVDSDTYEYVA
ncbi:cullin [Saccharomycopsis crataegensis]|uniref:Cullin n=1 Tax=Saccharomycopsis crataegensis TaxID=43959 RepID=A0AAV5QLF8_9ASCO|nr:cullin [Saccharomycopsis crataegensis]